MSTDPGETGPAWSDLDASQKQRVLELADQLDNDGVSRRDVIAGAGAVGVGALLGGGASQAMTEPAAASHGGGQVGTPSNRVDVYGHDADVKRVNNTERITDDITRITDGAIQSGTRYVVEGTHTVNDSILLSGVSNVILDLTNATITAGGQFRTVHLTETATDCTVRGGELDGDGGTSFDGLVFEGDRNRAYNVYSHDHGDSCLAIGTNGSAPENNVMIGCVADTTYGTTNATVVNANGTGNQYIGCTFREELDFLVANLFNATQSGYLGCDVIGNKAGTAQHGYWLEESPEDCFITGGTVKDMGGTGVRDSLNVPGGVGCQLSDVTVRDCGEGVRLHGEDNALKGFTVRNVDTDGVFVRGVAGKISDLTVDGAGNDGVRSEGPVMISNAKVKNSGRHSYLLEDGARLVNVRSDSPTNDHYRVDSGTGTVQFANYDGKTVNVVGGAAEEASYTAL